MADPVLIVGSAGALAFTGEFVREGGFPHDGAKAIVGTAGLMVVFSIGGQTRFRPVFSGLAWLILLGALYASVPAFQAARAAAVKTTSTTNPRPGAKSARNPKGKG